MVYETGFSELNDKFSRVILDNEHNSEVLDVYWNLLEKALGTAQKAMADKDGLHRLLSGTF